MKSNEQLAKENKWVEQPDEAPQDSTYRAEFTLANLSKERAFQVKKQILKIMGFEEDLWNKVSDTYLLVDLDIMNEKTGRYAHKVTDKY